MAESGNEKFGAPPSYMESTGNDKQPIMGQPTQQSQAYPQQGYPVQQQPYPTQQPHPAYHGYPNQGYPPHQQQPVYNPNQPNLVYAHGQTLYTAEQEPDNHRAFAILTMLFCCFPLGLVALIKSSEVSSMYAMGDMMRARMASNDAKKYSQIALGFGILNWVGVVIFMIVYFALVIPNLSSY